MDENYEKWLKELKVGDKVVVERSWQPEVLTITEVSEILPEGGIILKGFEDYGRVFTDGICEISHSPLSDVTNPVTSTIKMLIPTPERMEEISLRWWRTRLGAVNWFGVDDDTIRMVRETLKDVKWRRE